MSDDLQPEPPKKKFYFINEQVEWQLTKYMWSGCTSIHQRDLIMENANELIRQIIRKQGLHTIYPGQEESALGDLMQTAWVQIERTLYKYRSRPHCRSCYNQDRPSDSALYTPGEVEYGIITIEELIESGLRRCPKCDTLLLPDPIIEPLQGRYGGSRTVMYRGLSKVFNMWSQIARTVILAYIKKEGRDRKNSTSYTNYLDSKHKPVSDTMVRFLKEAREVCRYNDAHIDIINAMEKILHTDDKPHDCIIGKLVEVSGHSRQTVTGMMKMIRLRSFEFSDAPVNREMDPVRSERRRITYGDFEDES